MTRASNDKSPASLSLTRGAGSIVLAVHEVEGQALTILLRAAGGGPPALLGANQVSLAELPGAIAAAVKRHRPSRIVRVAPSAWCVARAEPSPPGVNDRRELAQALALLAEAELPGTAPGHRRAAAPFVLADTNAGEAAFLAAWVAGPSTPPTPLARGESWCPEPLALAAIGALAPGSPAAMLARADRSAGVLTILGSGPRRSIARALRIDASGDWDGAVADAVTESAAALGVETPHASLSTGLWLSAPIRAGTITGADTSDQRWLARFGPALGAALIAASTDPAVRPGAELQAESPELHTSQLHRAASSLASPSRAAAAIAIAAGLILLAPVAGAAARYAVLSARAGGGGGTPPIDQRLAEAERRAAHAELLRSRRWPMTKLWADVAGAAPVGVEIDAFDLSPEDGLAIRGTSQTPDLVADFRKRLSDTAIFRDIATPVLADEDGRTTFQLSAKVAAPLYRATPHEDFAAKTLAQRLYGDGASNAQASADDARDHERSGSGRGSGSRSDRRGRDERSSSDRPAQPAGPAAGTAPPPPLTDEQIAAMDRSTAMKEFGIRSRAAAIPGLDESTRQRLKDEATKAQQRMMQAMKEGGAAKPAGGPQ